LEKTGRNIPSLIAGRINNSMDNKKQALRVTLLEKIVIGGGAAYFIIRILVSLIFNK
jgi:hypothetical protein